MTEERDREVVGVFLTADALATAADALQSNGIDRARLSVLATGTPEQGAALTAAGFTTVRDLLTAPDVPRTAYTQPEDVATATGAIVSTLLYVGATLGAGLAAAAAGPVMAPIIAGAVASGAAGGGVGAYLAKRLSGPHRAYVEQSIAHGGLVLWVDARGDERRIIDLMAANGGAQVQAQDVPTRTPAD